MPNWCNNFVEVSHEDPRKIVGLRRAFRQGRMLDYIKPCPKELHETVAGYLGDSYAEELNQFKQQLNLKYFGAKDWYDWQTSNWGTKWDCGERGGDSRIDENNIVLNFDTAWSPPLNIYPIMEEQGYKIRAMYYEPGMCFAGVYEDGEDNCWTEWQTSEEARDILPEELDEMFGISEYLAEYEEEQRMEEELYAFVKEGAEQRKSVGLIGEYDPHNTVNS